MRSADARQSSLFTMLQPEDRVPRAHPLRKVREAAAGALADMRHRLDAAYPAGADLAAAPEEILRAMLLWALYGIPSERRLLEELEYNLLYRWFVGLHLDDRTFARVTFSTHRRRLDRAGLVRVANLGPSAAQSPGQSAFHAQSPAAGKLGRPDAMAERVNQASGVPS
jgi:transposase